MRTHAQEIFVPADVPTHQEKKFINNYSALTHNTGKLFLFTCDQKLEHVNSDFHGPDIHPQALYPEHLLRIAQKGRIGAMAAHVGLIARYAKQYSDIPFVAKLNGKTNLATKQDPYSQELWHVADVAKLKEEHNIPIVAIGITLYLGSSHEPAMLAAAAQAIFHAHQHGLIAIVWAYLRGSAITNEQESELIAGAAGVACTLGADFCKNTPPERSSAQTSAQLLQIATAAAGNTKVVCSGGKLTTPHHFSQELYDQIHTGGTQGCATRRNIFQRSLQEAIALTNAIAHIVYENGTVQKALNMV